MYQVSSPLSFLPQLEKSTTWKTNRSGGPKSREWRQQALHLEVRHIQSWWNHWSCWELSSWPSLSICIQRPWLCCADYKEIRFLVWRLSRCILPPVSNDLFHALHVAFRKTKPDWIDSGEVPDSCTAARYMWTSPFHFRLAMAPLLTRWSPFDIILFQYFL